MPSTTIYDMWYVSRISRIVGEVLQSKMTPQEENLGETKLNVWEQEYFWQYKCLSD
jgi:hypothetical protein